MTSLKINFLFQGFWQILTLILPLITSPILARALGAEGVGIYSYTYSIVLYFIMFANLGIHKYGNRVIAQSQKNKEKLSRSFNELYSLHLILSLIVILIYVMYVLFFAKYKLYAMLQIFFLIAALLDIYWFYAGIENFKFLVSLETVLKIITVILVIVIIRKPQDLPKYIVIMAVSSLIESIFYWITIRKHVTFCKLSLQSVLMHFKPICILFIPVALESIYNTMDKIMLGIMDTTQSVGFYENATKALIGKNLIFTLGIVMMPRMAVLFNENNKEQIDRYMRKSTEFTMILSTAFAFGTAGIAKEFAPIFWGDEFSVCSSLIIIMAFSLPFQTLSSEIRTHYLIPAARDKDYIISAAMGAVTNLGLNIFMIPWWGATGAAVATLISEAVVLIVQIYVVRKDIPVADYLTGNYFYFIPGVIMFITVRFIGESLDIHIYTLLLEVISGVFIYSIICLVYWRITNNKNYLDLINIMLTKIKAIK